jgi:hypothetical protein
MTPGELISRYNALRKTRLIIEAEQKAALAPYKEAEESIELELLAQLNAAGVDNFKSPDGTAYKTTHTNTKLVDRRALIEHCKSSGNFDYFTNSLAKEEVKGYVEKFKRPPPGVEVNEFIVVNVRKS